MHLKAAYFLEDLKLAIEKGCSSETGKLLSALSSYKHIVNTQPQHTLSDDHVPVVKVLKNLISRGGPTRMSLSLERKFAELLELKEGEEFGSIKNTRVWEQSLLTLAFRALHVIEPRINASKLRSNYENTWETLDSIYEEDFLFNQLPKVLGKERGSVAVQLADMQRSVEQLADIEFAQQWLQTAFNQQRADSVFDFPYAIDNRKGFIVEVDGPQHDEPPQIRLDNQRDEATHRNGWHSTIRIKTRQWHQMENRLAPLKEHLSSPVFAPYVQNINTPLHGSEEGLRALTATLSPVAIGRIQRSIVELIVSGHLSVNADSWSIAIVERDVPCATWAIEDFKEIWHHLLGMASVDMRLPQIDLKVCRTTEFTPAPDMGGKYHDLDELRKNAEHFDLLLDVSVLRRDLVMESDVLGFNASTTCTIRTAKYLEQKFHVATDDHVKYRPFSVRVDAEKHDEISETSEHLRFFLQWIFRKQDFRPGQLPILNRALQAESVIGLLPTGGGKSLTYQLAALLQPGVTMVVDPIKSLMKDQVDGLRDNLIDSYVFINGAVKGNERKLALERIASGGAQFVFLSPERLQIATFRQLLESMHERNVYFTFCVIDESHCVSEWGHDFRTSYLSVGANARKFCLTKNKSHIPIFGLTATASFDVLADVQRELSPFDGSSISDEAVIRYLGKRPELQFKIIEVKAFDDLKADELAALKDERKRKARLAKRKKDALQKALSELPLELAKYSEDATLSFGDKPLNEKEDSEDESTPDQHFERFRFENFDELNFYSETETGYQNAGVIFCPHRFYHFGVTDRYKNPPGANGVADTLAQPWKSQHGTFIGASGKDEAIVSTIENDNEANQTAFKKNQLGLLVATKAFGMGVDKPNIRYTFHFNYPQSIESLVQEAGRAGRDGKLALAHVLFNDESVAETFLRSNDQSSGLTWESSETPIAGYKKLQLPIDAQLVLDFHNSSFQGQNKEKRVLTELLSELRGPVSPRLSEFTAILPEDADLKLSLGDTYLFVKGLNGESYGGVAWTTLNQNTAWATVPTELASSKLEIVATALAELIANEAIVNLRDWFSEANGAEWQSIEDVLSRTEVGERFELTIPFTADLQWVCQHIKALIVQVTGATIAVNDIRSAGAQSFGSFMNFLSAIYRNNNHLQSFVEGNAELAKRLESRFYRFRQQADTEKAIYRLHCIGVLDDYTVDHNAHTFTVYGVKHEGDFYKQSLKAFIRRYYSYTRAESELEKYESAQGDTPIRKCLNLLVDFVYREIERKRFMAIKAVREACLKGIESENGNVAIKEYIHLYFFSKYARENFRTSLKNRDGEVDASLLDRTDSGKKDSVEWIWDFIDIAENDGSGPQIDNFKHLRGACTRILIGSPSPNYTLLLLQAFSQIFIEFSSPTQSQRQLQIASVSLIDGLKELEKKGVLVDMETFIRKFTKELTTMVGNSRSLKALKEFLAEAFDVYHLNRHIEWTRKFNVKLNYGNEKVDTSGVGETQD